MVSMFGPDWRASAEGKPNGSIVDLKTREVVTDSVRQPQSIVSAKGTLHVLGSLAGTVETVHDGRSRIKRCLLPGLPARTVLPGRRPRRGVDDALPVRGRGNGCR